MKATFCLWVCASALLSACSEKSETTTTAATNNSSAATSPLNAPASYLGALAKGQQAAVSTVDLTSLDKAIQMFSVENGRNPKDLNELVEQKFMPRIPAAPYGSKLEYDPASGKVSLVKQ